MKEYIVWNAINMWGGGDFNLSSVYELIRWFDDNEVSPLIEDVLSSPKRKIAFVPWLFTKPSLDPFYYDLSWADLVICWSNEPITVRYAEAMTTATTLLSNSNVIFVVNGALTIDTLNIPPQFFIDTDFASYVAYANQTMPDYHATTKLKMFDCLLGCERPHRMFILDKLKRDNLLDKSFVSLCTTNNEPVYQSPELNLYDLTEYQTIREQNQISAHGTMHNYPGINYSIPGCFMLPHRIYENSWYSIVAESKYENVSTLTEKTIKPFLARRIFIAFAPAGHLRYLKRLGYATFSDIIDESYDEIEGFTARMSEAWNQVVYLSKLDPVDTYNKMQGVLNHNRWVAVNRRPKFKEIKAFIQSHIDKL